MRIEFDAKKNEANIKKHGFSLDVFELLDFDTVRVEAEVRQPYGEHRLRMYAYLNGRLCIAIFTMRGATYRIISFRKANAKERERYEKK
jgi:uncharacterized DUF497 family protein